MPSIHEPHRLASVVVTLAFAMMLACSAPPDACPACAQNAPGAADAATPPAAAAGADAAAEGGEDQGEDKAEDTEAADGPDDTDGGAPAKGDNGKGEK